MVLFRKAGLGLLFVLLSSAAAGAQSLTPEALMAANAIQKAVPGTDKSSAEVIGTVRQAFPVTSCGTASTLLVVGVKGLLPGSELPVTGVCTGALNTPCRRLRAGSRIRLQGLM